MKPLILLVDDVELNLQLLDKAVSSFRVDRIHANSGQEAIKEAAKREPAVILMDVQMPDMDGFETARCIREIGGLSHVPIIFITGTETSQERIYCGYEAGAISLLFQNLLANAIKFRSKSKPVINVNAKKETDEWTIQVCDNGIGLDGEHHEKIFEIFKRLHTSDEYPGTGIGLAICTQILKLHGGRIWVDSQKGAGSTFSFTLPLSMETKLEP